MKFLRIARRFASIRDKNKEKYDFFDYAHYKYPQE